jgi:hypothetical protein
LKVAITTETSGRDEKMDAGIDVQASCSGVNRRKICCAKPNLSLLDELIGYLFF